MLGRKIGLAFALSVFAASSLRAETVLTFSSWIPLSHGLNVNLYVPWAEAVEKASNGEIKVRFLPKAVAAPDAHFDAVRTGQADIAFGTHGYSPQQFAAYHFTDFPFLGDTSTVTSVALQRTHEKFFASQDLYRGVHLIGMNTLGPGVLYHTKKFIESPDDMVGQKIRTGGVYVRRLVEGLGGVSVAQPITKAYELLSTGVVDGHAGHWEQMVGFRLADVLPYATYIQGGLNSGSMYLIINQEKYESLSPQGKEAIDRYSGETFARMAGEAWDKINEEGRAAHEEAGGKTIVAPAPVLEAMQKINAQFEEEYYATAKEVGLDGPAVLEFFRAEVEKLRAQ